MKFSLIQLSLALLLILGVTACSDPFEKINADPAEKKVESTQYAFSQVPGLLDEIYAAEIRHYSDGTVEVSRSVTHQAPANKPINLFVEGASSKSSGDGESFNFPNAGWYIPFDPSAQAISFSGGTTIEILCECDARGSCNLFGQQNPDGTYTMTCIPTDCPGNCDATVIIRSDRSTIEVGSGMIVRSTTIQVF